MSISPGVSFPGITVETASALSVYRRAASAGVGQQGRQTFSRASTRWRVAPNRSPRKSQVGTESAGHLAYVFSPQWPISDPESNGTRATGCRAGREQLVGRAPLEHVEPDLQEVDEPGPGDVDALVGAVVPDRDADPVDLALRAEGVEGLQPVQGADAVGEPTVQPKEVQPVGPEPTESQLDPGAQVPFRIAAAHLRTVVLRDRPDDGPDLRGDVDALPVPPAQRLADHLFAVAVPVVPGRVDDVHTGLEGVEQAPDRRLVVHPTPLPAEPPASERDLADLHPVAPGSRYRIGTPEIRREGLDASCH
jgi:hypothetical protein